MKNVFSIDKSSHEQLIDVFLKDLNFQIECSKLTVEEEDFLNILLKKLLINIGKDNVFDYISYIYREILNNAKKGNLKRLYFIENNLTITNKDDYSKGMINFKKALISETDKFTESLPEQGFYIKTGYTIIDDILEITIENNSCLTNEEKKVINDKIQNATEFKSIEDAMITVTNNPEGAGLGLIISILILKKLNLDQNNLIIFSDDRITHSTIKIPLSVTTAENQEFIKDTILSEIEDIPQFPEHIMQIQNMLLNDNIDIKELSKVVIRDAALTGRIIKFSNSPLYLTYREVSSISDAIKTIGLSGLKSIIYSYGSEKILKERYKTEKLQGIFTHCNNVANIAFSLAKKKLHRHLLENLYIAALLHDLGKILAIAIDETFITSINKICHDKEISLSLIEKIAQGINHRTIGGLLARKWNFPDLLIDVIDNHHSPEKSHEENKDIVYFVYFANCIENHNKDYEKIYTNMNKESLDFFRINTPDDIKKIVDHL
ncbi:MAG: hypothetical protein A2015_07435 [Spirochaetes bacterium GWF1_31_7]|nr:MAG: hypothetical protein A2Y30_02810 [Spirochaetes bacterium GWE1_32_154]OHD47589.1 MAG: hypothetical protein A2Y29_00255 [Spirochaetes bacterium GWE2_31_10]OHD51250.1 MAG: hypothetical protein A2015_07435 [Spirochaetes bacterium GWF1_31_7]OHD81621.1 MAG: hypothetical protein A2355_11085 [Spirochaetes bacterium RIFOXYB1_FULL_32_8]HBD96146.1 hypothetical protein [Spirochaetia bacterium]